ncbi:hypothetical protein MAPG_09842 [Magnaporthiopsis poae ATCC 64411]|uniref:Uncharacterized protein n=1 Tax=Magnaporthiopsis poae (strain ATCC 64411 / 73-15) TaxID=644358 RepID=A0A0C4EB02_MAGP6|nr:hypothetical protein MAPG_09842 [Magnaporthiopsis poae ATCC 64411]
MFLQRHIAVFGVLLLLTQRALAQSIAVSSTAAWSSQIVAFWGAILIAVRSSVRGQVTNAISSLWSSARAAARTRRIDSALGRGNWFVHSGWNNGRMRAEIAVVLWRTAEERRRLSRRLALLVEVFGDAWEVIVLGCRLEQGSDDTEGRIEWIKSPRSPEMSSSRLKETRGPGAFPLGMDDLDQAADALRSGDKVAIETLVQALSRRCDLRGTRCTVHSEMPPMESEANPSWSRIFTSVDLCESPFLGLSRWTGAFATSRGAAMKLATRMYFAVHVAVSCAIGLMAAAAGRGLAVWLLAVRPTLASLGCQGIQGNNYVGSLLALDKSSWYYETSDGSRRAAADMDSPPMPALRERLSGRLVGIWKTPYFVRLTVGKSTEVSVDSILQSQTHGGTIIGLVATLARDGCAAGDDRLFIAKCALRLPETGHALARFLTEEVFQYGYEVDDIVTQGGPPVPVTVGGIYPWIQTGCCIVLTFMCCCVSIVYAYYGLPFWVKPVTEVVTAASATWFGTLERVGGLAHSRDTYVCFMIATLITSSVWYVGVKDVG